MRKYIALTCGAAPDVLDVLVAFSARLPITGVVEGDGEVTLYFDEADYRSTMPDDLLAWLPDTRASFRIGMVEEQNWNAEFERSLQPVRIHPDLVITQSWNPVRPESADDLVVVIDPKMSFGTGHHESTRLIARLMPELDFAGGSVLDIGTGTGVLAIVAAKRGAARVVAIDNNEWAIGNARENFEMNGVAGMIELRQCELARVAEREFDVVLANIHRSVIIELLPGIVAKMSPKAVLLTSGVLIEDHDSLNEAASHHNLFPAADERENEWIATRFQFKD